MARILVVYYSGSGNTRKMAELVARGARELGHDVDLVVADEVEMKELKEADAVGLGSPDYYTYMAGQLKTFFDRALDVRDEIIGKPAHDLQSARSRTGCSAPHNRQEQHCTCEREAAGGSVLASCAPISHMHRAHRFPLTT